MMVIGIGATSTATSADIVSAARDCCARGGAEVNELAGLASLDRPETRDAIQAAADKLGVRASFWSRSTLQAEAARCQTQSVRSIAAAGVPSVAEASALTAAGPGSRLIVPRIAFPKVTAALAMGAA